MLILVYYDNIQQIDFIPRRHPRVVMLLLPLLLQLTPQHSDPPDVRPVSSEDPDLDI